MFDSHVHSSFSGDSKLDANEACSRAIELGLEGIAFTDHLDLDYPNQDEAFFLIDFDKYSVEMDALIKKYAGKLKVLKGIEVGIQPQVIQDTLRIVESYDFDFVIGSIHVIDRMDPYFGDYFEGKTKEQTFCRYLKEIIFMLENYHDFDVVGHIGYLRRYCSYDDKTLRHADYTDLLEMILKKVISMGKGLEINTSGYRNVIASPMPDYDILKRYRELGGEILTIGSDSHAKEHMGLNFEFVTHKLKEIGFNYTVHFEKRKPVFDKI